MFLNNQMEQSKDVFSTDCQEIIEPFDAKEEEEWKRQHILNVRNFKKEENKDYSDINHEDVMNRLELLELEEEIEQLHSVDIDKLQSDDVTIPKKQPIKSAANPNRPEQNNTPKNQSRESVIRKRLLELKKNKTKCVTEDDVLKRLDQLQEEEDLQDELESLCENNDIEEESEDTNDSTASEDSDYDNENSTLKYTSTDITTTTIDSKNKSKRKISFADETVKATKATAILNFSHSDTPIAKFDFKGDLKCPSDIYSFHPECFKKEPKSIIKNTHRVIDETHNIVVSKDKIETHNLKNESNSQEIIIGDIIEHSKVSSDTHLNENINGRPVSKFKSMRMSSKQSKNSS